MLNLSPFLITVVLNPRGSSLASENSRHFTTPPLVFPQNDVSGTSAELHTNELDLPDLVMYHQNGISLLVPQTSYFFMLKPSGGIAVMSWGKPLVTSQ